MADKPVTVGRALEFPLVDLQGILHPGPRVLTVWTGMDSSPRDYAIWARRATPFIGPMANRYGFGGGAAGWADGSGVGAGGLFTHSFTQFRNVSYQSTLFCGLETQCPSSGKISSFDGTF